MVDQEDEQCDLMGDSMIEEISKTEKIRPSSTIFSHEKKNCT
jgi:hypothetical protein